MARSFAVVLLALAATCQSQDSKPSIGPSLGVAVTPKNFPNPSPADIDEAFDLAASFAGHAVFIWQWGKFEPAIAKLVVEKCRKKGMEPILSLSPTTLDQGRKELDLPPDVRRRAGKNLSFENPVIQEAFIQAAQTLAQFKPRYLCLATEINFLAARIEEYIRFAALYKEAYKAVKRISPGTRVFVSFQWEFALILDLKEPNRVKEHSKLFDIFRPELDAVALTTYPTGHHKTPADMPKEYYSLVYRHVKKSDEILFTEVGWPSGGSGSEAEQVEFIGRLPGLIREVKPTVIAWSLLHDVAHPAFDANLATTGLLTDQGRRKPAFDRFKGLKR